MQARSDLDPAALEEISASFEKLNAASSHRITMIMPDLPPQEMNGEEMDVEILPMVRERSGDLLRMSMSARGEEMEFTLESMIDGDRHAYRILSPQMEAAFAQMREMPTGIPGMPGGAPALPGPLGALGGIPGVSSVVGGALGNVPGASRVMGSPLFQAGMGLLTGGLTPMNLITQGLNLAGGAMGGGLLGAGMSSMLGGTTPRGKWACRNLAEELETVERYGGEVEAEEAESAAVEPGAEALTKVARLGEATLEGETFQSYLLAMEHQGTAVEVTLYTRGPGGLPRRLEIASPELGGTVAMDYGDFDTVTVEFPECE
ncbi:MAG: hypothetical protein ACRELC_12995 [Gemmatimonadota bacterium]